MNKKTDKKAWLALVMLLPALLFAGKYSGEIFQLAPGVANQAMGGTGLTDKGNVSAAWWNPALLNVNNGKSIELMHAEQFEGLMQLNSAAARLGTDNTMGIVINHVGINNVGLTRLENDSLPPSPDNQPYIYKRVNNNDLIASLGIGRRMRENLFLGIAPKLAYRNLAEKSGFGFGADLGLLWQINPKFAFGAVAKDFFSTQIIWENGTVETALPSLNTEMSLENRFSKKQIPYRLVLNLESMFEGRAEAATINAGPWSADLHAGLAINPIPQLKLMAGYDVDAITTGLGIQISKLNVEYAIKLGSEEDLGYSQRVSAGWRW